MITQTQIVFFLLAGLFGLLFLIFVYYLYNEKLVTNQYQGETPFALDKLAPEVSSNTTIVPANGVNSGSGSGSGSTSGSGSGSTSSYGLKMPQQPPRQTLVPSKQVYNVSENKYTYDEARALCKVFDKFY